MREIKFRAWLKDEKEMVEVLALIKASIQYDDCGMDRVEFDEENYELMQYTGLQDKNGKEIYEGDLVKLLSPYDGEDITAVVRIGKFYDEDAEDWFVGVYLKNHDVCVSIYAEEGEFLESSKVIGNIYENPELLEV